MCLWRWLPFLMNKRSEVHSTDVPTVNLYDSVGCLFNYSNISLFDFTYIVLLMSLCTLGMLIVQANPFKSQAACGYAAGGGGGGGGIGNTWNSRLSWSGFVLPARCPGRISASEDMTRYVIVRLSTGFCGNTQPSLCVRSACKRRLMATNMSNLRSLLKYLLSFLFSHLTIELKSLTVIFRVGVWASLDSFSPKTFPSCSTAHCCHESMSAAPSVDLLYRLYRPSLCVFRMRESVENKKHEQPPVR